ncbi:MAG: hypothetical protein V8T86_01920 [Victivallis sp.]
MVSSGGSAVNTVIDHGVGFVKSGGIASNTTLNNSSLNIQSGGLLRDRSRDNRALLSLASGAELGGVIRVAGFLAAHGAVTVQSGGRIDLLLEGRSPAASSIINSIGSITAATSGGLRITVTENMIAAGGCLPDSGRRRRLYRADRPIFGCRRVQ